MHSVGKHFRACMLHWFGCIRIRAGGFAYWSSGHLSFPVSVLPGLVYCPLHGLLSQGMLHSGHPAGGVEIKEWEGGLSALFGAVSHHIGLSK